MKRFCAIAISLILIFSLSACQKHLIINNSNITTNFKSNITVNISNELYACSYTRNKDETSLLKIDSPSDISGLTFSNNLQGYAASLEGISLNNNQENLPAFSLIKIIDTILDYIDDNNELTQISNENNKTVLKGKTQDYDFEVTISSENNFIEKININAIKAEFIFFNQQAL